MALQKLDKKQVPQMAVLAVLSCGVLGYFAKQMMTPSPAAAHSSAPAASSTSSAKKTPAVSETNSPTVSASASTDGADGQTDDQLPSPDVSMRDPFQQTVPLSSTAPSSPAPKPAALVRPLPVPRMGSASVPFAPPLPTSSAFGSLRSFSRPAPSLPSVASVPSPAAQVTTPAPTWTVTGVLTSGTEHVAILRSGAERRFVRQGDWLDGQLQVTHVGRDSVTLGQGARFYTLPLGGGQHPGYTGGSSTPVTRPAEISSVPVSASVPKVMPELTTPSAVSVRPAVRKPSDPPVLASVPHLWTSAPSPAQQSALVKNLAAPRLALSTSLMPSLIVPALHHTTKVMVKVAAFHAKSIVRRAAPHGMLAIGTLAPDFTLPTLDGSALSLSQLRGRPVVVTFWASWVDACGRAVPALQKVASDGHAAFVGVGTWDSRPTLLSFARTHRLDTRSLLCDDSVANLSVAVSLYKVPDVPACYILDSEGRVAAVFTGFTPDTAEAVRAILLTLEAS